MVLNGFYSVKPISISRRRKLKWLFEFLVLLFLVLHRSSLFSLAGPVLRHLFRRLVVVLNSHIFVFVVFHTMLFVVYSLSHLTDNKSGSNRNAAESAPGVELPESLAAPRDDSVDKILVVGEKNTATPVDDSVAEKNQATSPVNGVSIDATPTKASVTATAEIAPEIRRYRRTESERFEDNREKRTLRQWKTEIHRADGGESVRFLNLVDEMDIDDFNRTVESFIAEQKLHIGGKTSG